MGDKSHGKRANQRAQTDFVCHAQHPAVEVTQKDGDLRVVVEDGLGLLDQLGGRGVTPVEKGMGGVLQRKEPPGFQEVAVDPQHIRLMPHT